MVYLLGEVYNAFIKFVVALSVKIEVALPYMGRYIDSSFGVVNKVESRQTRAQFSLENTVTNACAEICSQPEKAL